MNRYSYVVNNPLRYTDPTGHMCHPEDDCGGPHSTTSSRIYDWKWRIKHKYGISTSDEGGKNWNASNLSLMYSSLEPIDGNLNGGLSSLVGGATMSLGEHHPDRNHPNSTYSGFTSGLNIIFYTTGTQTLHQMNVFHEFGHLVDNGHGIGNGFSNALQNLDDPSFRTSERILDTQALTSVIVTDPNYGSHVAAVQHEDTGSIEQWADIFANYVAGNIDLSKSAGAAMYNFVIDALFTAPNNLPPATGI